MLGDSTWLFSQIIFYNKYKLINVHRLGLLLNLCCHISTANTKFKDFDKIQANLGSTVTFDLPPRFTTTAGLVASFEPAVQRVLQLVADQANNTSFAVTAQQRIFNLEKGEEDYMRVFGKSAIAELANLVEGKHCT